MENDRESLLRRATALHDEGRFADMADVLRALLEKDPDDAETITNLAVALRRQGETAEALRLLTRSVQLAPEDAAAWYNLANAVRDSGDIESAVAAYRRAIANRGSFIPAILNLSLVLMDRGAHADAASVLSGGLGHAPMHTALNFNMGIALWKLRKFDAARIHYERALRAEPGNFDILHNLATLLMSADAFDEAIEVAGSALDRNPGSAETYAIWAQSLGSQGRIDEALAVIERGLAVGPDNISLHTARARMLLLKGELAAGWVEYAWRWRRPVQPMPDYAQPRWEGDDIAGRTVLLHSEQGLGDTIQAVRYAPLMAAQGARVILHVEPVLAPLLEFVPGVETVVPKSETPPPFDLHTPMLDLPGLFSTTLESIPSEVPYIRLGDARPGDPATDGRPWQVGLVWAGRPTHNNDHNRSLALGQLMPLLALDGVSFHSLQVGDRRADIAAAGAHGLIADTGARLQTMLDTARVIQRLDLVITVDTACAHLAGALGAPVWTLLPFAPDWRWMLDRPDSPWYPTMRLYRQHSVGDWSSVIGAIANDLRKLMSG